MCKANCDRHQLRVTGKCRLPDIMSGTGQISISGTVKGYIPLLGAMEITFHSPEKSYNLLKSSAIRWHRQNILSISWKTKSEIKKVREGGKQPPKTLSSIWYLRRSWDGKQAPLESRKLPNAWSWNINQMSSPMRSTTAEIKFYAIHRSMDQQIPKTLLDMVNSNLC